MGGSCCTTRAPTLSVINPIDQITKVPTKDSKNLTQKKHSSAINPNSKNFI